MSRIEDTNSAAKSVREQGEQAVASGVQHAKDAVRNVGNNLRDVSDQAREKLDHLRESAGEYYETGRDKAREWEGELEEYVRDQPLKSLLIAAGVGMLLGVVWRRL